jgi:hypothetical protein
LHGVIALLLLTMVNGESALPQAPEQVAVFASERVLHLDSDGDAPQRRLPVLVRSTLCLLAAYISLIKTCSLPRRMGCGIVVVDGEELAVPLCRGEVERGGIHRRVQLLQLIFEA